MLATYSQLPAVWCLAHLVPEDWCPFSTPSPKQPSHRPVPQPPQCNSTLRHSDVRTYRAEESLRGAAALWQSGAGLEACFYCSGRGGEWRAEGVPLSWVGKCQELQLVCLLFHPGTHPELREATSLVYMIGWILSVRLCRWHSVTSKDFQKTTESPERGERREVGFIRGSLFTLKAWNPACSRVL